MDRQTPMSHHTSSGNHDNDKWTDQPEPRHQPLLPRHLLSFLPLEVDDRLMSASDAAFFRHRFQDDASKARIWSLLLENGWKYRAPEYIAPNGEIFKSSGDVLKMLDQTALVPLNNTLQMPPISQDHTTTTSISDSEKWRRTLIEKFGEEVDWETRCDETTDDDDDDTTIVEATKKTTRASKRLQQPNKKHKSATIFDAGADLFLTKQSKKRKLGEEEQVRYEFPSACEVAQVYKNATTAVKTTASADYNKWKFLLSTNHSLLLYGFGSKRHVLTDFCKTTLEPVGDVLEIDGFDASVSVAEIFNLMVQMYLQEGNEENDDDDDDLIQQAVSIGQAIAAQRRHRPLFLVLHNLDGLRTNRTEQQALARLIQSSTILNCNVRTIRLVVTVDHVNTSALLWDADTKFDFIWIQHDTFQPYTVEMSRGSPSSHSTKSSTRRRKTEAAASTESVSDVLYTIAPRHTEVLQVLARLQQRQQPGKHIPYLDFFQACKAEYVVTSESTLRGYLTELLDHGLMEKSRQEGVGEVVQISHEKVEEILSFKIIK